MFVYDLGCQNAHFEIWGSNQNVALSAPQIGSQIDSEFGQEARSLSFAVVVVVMMVMVMIC